MARITLQPVSRFAFLVVAAHAGAGALLWWWLAGHAGTRPASSPQQVSWVSPADIEVPARAASTAARVVETPPPPLPAEPPSATSPELKSIAAVAGSPPPAAPRPPLPKAIAIDPAEAAALMKAAEKEEK